MEQTVDFTTSGPTQVAIQRVLIGERGGIRGALLFVGPALIASIAYMDPGNFATNIQAGAAYGYGLLWVVWLANLVAMLFQALSARLGIVTGRNLAETCRDHFPYKVVVTLWVVSEIAAIATDLAEFVGGAIGFSLLAHIPLLAGMVVTGIITYALLVAGGRGFRRMEIIIGALVLTIAACYATELIFAHPPWSAVAAGSFMPRLPDANALTISVGIIGATVMPHALYLHSGLTQARARPRHDADRARLVRFSNREVVVALTLAGVVNVAMVIMASSAFHAGHRDVADISTAYHTLSPLLGRAAASVFLVSLLASGVSSSVVGTMAGQLIMQGFIRRRIPVWLRRVITMVPAFVVIALGINPTEALVVSQVVLSFALPVPMFALVYFTSNPKLMGHFATGRIMRTLAFIAALFILVLNILLLVQTFSA
jgi:manganese transport protein